MDETQAEEQLPAITEHSLKDGVSDPNMATEQETTTMQVSIGTKSHNY